ncbi:HAD-IA family hydrolase [candidate division KSB1 bacterium]|nr:HAD-IA family hydrolase [candidate division KSB1 bacterium]
MMKQIDLLIFDLDGTLVDTRRDLANSVNFALNALNLPALQIEEVMSYVGDGLKKLLDRSLPKDGLENIGEVIDIFREHYREHCLDFSGFYPDVVNILNYFQDKKMTVVSNKPEEFTRLILEGLRIADFFEIILGGDSLPLMKPDPGPILHILDKLNASNEKTAIVGDGTTDIEAGKAANILTCAVTYGLKEKEVLLKMEPDFMIDDIVELKRIFE